jgi:aspartyl/asparaginyl-tRNA synthetase
MDQSPASAIGQSINNFQAALTESGSNLQEFIRDNYLKKWQGDDLYNAMAIRTTFVNAMHTFLTRYGLLNMERVSLSPVTDPLAHDVEHTPSIMYKGHNYMTTHSMIYSKFLACFNRKVKGIFVDSPNIRLEIESPTGVQRGKYLIDFSQMDIELRRNRGIQLDEYLNHPNRVKKVLAEDMEKALTFFEELIIDAMTAVANNNEANLKALGVVVKVPKSPFPRFRKDEVVAKQGPSAVEATIGKTVDSQFFWITGLMRENYDLIYPYLKPDGSRTPIKEFTSDMIYNYDLCAQGILRETGKPGMAYEVLSGALREWLYEPIVERLIDNKVLPVRPRIVDGNIENVDELGGYGPFLMAVSQRNANGTSMFPDTFGGGVGIERCLFALCRGPQIKKVDDVTLFGKNPDSHPLYLF